MRILIFSYKSFDNCTYAGGGWISSLATSLSCIGHNDIAIAYPSTLYRESFSKDNITYYPIKYSFNKIKEYWFSICRKPLIYEDRDQVDNIVDDFNPDIIQLFGLETGIGGLLSHITKYPVVVHIQGICVPCLENWFPKGFSYENVKKFYPFRLKVINATEADYYYRFEKIARREVENYKKYKYFFGRTEWDKEVSLYFSPDRKYYNCNEAIRSEFYMQMWKGVNKPITFTTVMNGEIYKGYDTILLVASKLRKLGLDFNWNVYGVNTDTPMVRVAENILKLRFNDCNVKFCGRKNASELSTILSNTTLYIHPSHIDNSPNSVCEAMVVGCPVIATKVGGVPSIIEDSVTGYLVPDGDTILFANKIAKLINDIDELNRISVNSRTIARERHNSEKIIAKLMIYYNEIIKDFKG